MGEGKQKAVAALVLGVVAVAAGIGVGMLRRAPPPPVTASTLALADEQPGLIDVHVAGWVVAPGVVSVRAGSILAEVIEAAGGLRAGAKVDQINLAAEAVPGQQIVVPGPGAIDAGTAAATGTGLISINNASSSELEELPGVGPVLAERIVTFREENGPFQAIEDLLQVTGIGEAKLSSIRDLVQP